MSHGDRVTASAARLPRRRRQRGRALRRHRRRCAPLLRRCMFHPEVVHTPHGAQLLRNFTHHVAGCAGDWTMAAFRDEEIARIRAQVGEGRVICGLSGGVDSAVAAVLIHEAIGDQLTCIFVDHGLLRHGEAEEVVAPVPRPLQHPAGPSRRVRPVPRRAGRRHRPGTEAQDHRPPVHRRVRGGGAQDRRRRFPGPGHALSRRHRERQLHRRPERDHQVAPQCRRPAGAHAA